MNYVIEKNVPVADRTRGRPSVARDFMKRLEIGDSFLIRAGSARDARNKTQNACGAARRAGVTVMTRRISEFEHRVWRTA